MSCAQLATCGVEHVVCTAQKCPVCRLHIAKSVYSVICAPHNMPNAHCPACSVRDRAMCSVQIVRCTVQKMTFCCAQGAPCATGKARFTVCKVPSPTSSVPILSLANAFWRKHLQNTHAHTYGVQTQQQSVCGCICLVKPSTTTAAQLQGGGVSAWGFPARGQGPQKHVGHEITTKKAAELTPDNDH